MADGQPLKHGGLQQAGMAQASPQRNQFLPNNVEELRSSIKAVDNKSFQCIMFLDALTNSKQDT